MVWKSPLKCYVQSFILELSFLFGLQKIDNNPIRIKCTNKFLNKALGLHSPYFVDIMVGWIFINLLNGTWLVGQEFDIVCCNKQNSIKILYKHSHSPLCILHVICISNLKGWTVKTEVVKIKSLHCSKYWIYHLSMKHQMILVKVKEIFKPNSTLPFCVLSWFFTGSIS